MASFRDTNDHGPRLLSSHAAQEVRIGGHKIPYAALVGEGFLASKFFYLILQISKTPNISENL